jgi:iron-sulfur cluster repair protein YtfE (RIC family)
MKKEKAETLETITEEQKTDVEEVIEVIMDRYASKERKKLDILVERLDTVQQEAQQGWDLVRGLIELLRNIDAEKVDAFMEAKTKERFKGEVESE